MTSWKPGQPVRTEADTAAWKEWRRESKREQQRFRREHNSRIDYYPDKAAASILFRLCCRVGGCTYSDTLNRIIAEWAEQVPPE